MVSISLFWLVLIAAVLSLPTTPEPHYFTQNLDHFQSPGFDQVTFRQRYWLVDEFWDGSGPVFLYLCGQLTCPGLDPEYLYPLDLAKRFHAVFISVEHRFYGLSQPKTIASLQPAVPSALEVSQALGDIAELVRSLKLDEGLRRSRWIVVGGGYAGALAAWLRTKYPGLVHAAWASSATVLPVLDFWQFDRQVTHSLSQSGQECVRAVTEMTDFASELYERRQTETIAAAFNATGVFRSDVDQRTVLWMLGETVGKLVVGGYRTELCGLVSGGEPMRTLRTVAEVAKVKSMQIHGLVTPADYSSAASRNRTRGDASRQSHWQSCSQLGLFPTPGNFSMRSPLLTLSFYSLFCSTVFPYPSTIAPSLPLSLSYMGTRILYTNGEEDPWQWVSYREGSRPAQELFSEKIECNDCSHCVDLKTPREDDPIQLKQARKRIEERIAMWVK